MKKTFYLILCLPLLLLGGCKEEPEVPNLHYGSFVQSGLIIQNTAVTMTIDTDGLNVPVTELYVKLHNDSDYIVTYRQNDRFLEVYKGGGWQAAHLSDHVTIYEIDDIIPPLDAHTSGGFSMHFAERITSRGEATQYAPLEAGVYRLRLPGCRFEDLPEGIEAQTFEIVGYFTIYP